ncbi:MAG: HAMP domain-containing histidine kinase, partial [Thiovulaceae bacterium]|nr:HAMP domain-containing histidine kinase [Sulfurimonadaceae bacterium]
KEKQLIITIEDNGKGIKQEDIDYIFEPYFSTKKELNGTGLGLYRSKQIIERNLDGAIKMYSDGSKTQTFLTLAILPYAK